MAYRFNFNSGYNNTNYETCYSNNYLGTENIPGFPQGNYDRWGNRQVRLYNMGADWSSGATYVRINMNGDLRGAYQGILTNPLGSFGFHVGHGGGCLRVGRRTGIGLRMYDSADGDSVDGGISGWLEWATVPWAPGNVSVTPTSPTTAVATWGGPGSDGGAGLSSYRIEWTTDQGNWAQAAAENVSPGVTIPGLTPGGYYYYRITVANEVGWSQFSGVTGYQQIAAAPNAPTVTVSASGTSATVSWNAVSTATGYEVNYSTTSNFANSTTVATSNNSTTVTQLTPGTPYFFRVRTKNSAGFSPYSSSGGGTTPNVPSAPSITTVSPADDGESATVNLDVSGVTGNGATVSGYQLQYATNSGFTTGLTTISATSGANIVGPLTPSETYYYRARAINSVGNGAWSAVVTSAQPDPGLGWIRDASNGAFVDMEGRIRNAGNTTWVEMDGRIRSADNTGWSELGS